MLEASNYLFATYHLHYKENIASHPTETLMCIVNYLYFLYYLSNLLTAFFPAHNSSTCTAKLGLVTKKRELSRTFLYLLSNAFEPSSFFFSLMLLEMHLAMLRYIVIFVSQLSLT